MEKTTLYLPSELQGELRALARRTGRPQAELIREAIAGYVAQHERPWPTSIGAGSGSKVSAAESKDWLRREWDREVEQIRRRRRRS